MAGIVNQALLVNVKAMEEKKAARSKAIIEVVDDGPIKITGFFHLNDVKRGREEFPSEVLLCRCGKSANKPFCDSSHKKK